MTVTRSQFREQHKAGIKTDDQETLNRLKQAGVDGKKLLQGADTNKDGKVEGTGELNKLFSAVDDLDKDGSRHTISDKKPSAVLAALKKDPAMPGGPVDQAKVDGLYAPDAPTGLARGAKGPEVKAAQEKLIRAGYDLPKHGADSDFGAETETAVKQFQADRKPPLPQTGVLDDATMKALDAAPKVNRQAPVNGVQYPEYDQMFKDGVMQTTMAVGFDEDGWDLPARRTVLEGLQQRGFDKLDVANLTDAQLKEKGFDPATIDRSATYYTKEFQHEGKPVKALVRLIDRDSPNAKEQFSKGMKGDDLILYSGHGRRGSGPDFDADKSAAGNYVIGKPYEDGHYALGKNDVKKAGAMSNNYQLMMFAGCTTNLYIDDMRQARNKTQGNLDIVASQRLLNWGDVERSSLAMLDGVMGGKSIQDIQSSVNAINARDGEKPGFITDGFKGNRYQPLAQQ
ncbi:MAG: peptidoglycan-binding protein [Deltaproteobacteria bacterium]|nr:peptidoglycan-binding protein [Deltaproteobacteria bacterium]